MCDPAESKFASWGPQPQSVAENGWMLPRERYFLEILIETQMRGSAVCVVVGWSVATIGELVSHDFVQLTPCPLPCVGVCPRSLDSPS